MTLLNMIELMATLGPTFTLGARTFTTMGVARRIAGWCEMIPPLCRI